MRETRWWRTGGRSRWLLLLAVGLIVAGSIVAITGRGGGATASTEGGTYHPVTDGDAVQLAGTPVNGFPALTATGQVRVVNFWAVWCGPCKDEAPVLKAAHARLAGSAAQFVSVNISDSAEKAVAYAHHEGWDWPQLHDASGANLRTFKLLGMPDTLIVGPNGTLRGYFEGPVPSVKALTAAVASAQSSGSA